MSLRAQIFWWSLLPVLWGARLVQVNTGQYFSHAVLNSDPSDLGTSYTLQIATLLRVVPALLSVALWKKHKLLALAVLVPDLGYVLFSGARLSLIHIALMVGIVVSLQNKRIPIWTIAVPTLLFMFVVNPLVYRMREIVAMDDANRGLGPSEVIASVFSEPQGQRDEDEINGTFQRTSASGYLADIMCLADKGTFEFLKGATFVNSVLILVPRALWRNKPDVSEAGDMIGVMETRLGLPFLDGLGSPVMEGYVNFSYAGVFFVFTIMGLVSRGLWAYRLRNSQSLGCLGLYLMALPTIFLFETHSTFGLLTTLRLPLLLMLAIAAFRIATGRPVVTPAAASPST